MKIFNDATQRIQNRKEKLHCNDYNLTLSLLIAVYLKNFSHKFNWKVWYFEICLKVRF